MKLAFCLFNYFPFGGLECDFLRITEATVGRGHRVNVFTMYWKGERPPGVDIIPVPYQGITNHCQCVSYVKHLGKILKASEYDLIVGFNRMPGLDLYYAADVCYVDDVRRYRNYFSRFTPRYRVYSRFEEAVFASNSPTEIMYLSELQKKHYIDTYGTDDGRFHYVPPGIDKERIRAECRPEVREQVRREYKLAENDIFLLMVGSHFRTKGVSRSIIALAALPENIKCKTCLFIVGVGESRPFEKLAGSLGVDGRVRFLGGRNDVPRFLAGADILLQPSLRESAGNVIVEALVAGLPILATETCGYGFHVKKAEAGKLIAGNHFRQEEMNAVLTHMVSTTNRNHWRHNALLYADHTDLYSRPQRAAEIIEELAQRSKTRKSHSPMNIRYNTLGNTRT